MGPKTRFTEISDRLEKKAKYNSKTRKVNRNYLEAYLKARKNIGSDAVEARKAQAVGLMAELNVYVSPKKNETKKKEKEKLPPAPKYIPSPEASKSDLYTQVDVKGDGNCFYRALYRAAADHEDKTILDRLFTILGADKSKKDSEDTGHAALRKAISEIFRKRFLARDGIYELLLANYGTIQFRLLAAEATTKQAALYRNIKKYAAKKDGKAEFYNDLANIIATNKEYATEIDYMNIADILDAGGLKVVSSKGSPKSGIFDGKPALYIKRLSYDHYNYWKRKPGAPAPKPAAAEPAPEAPKPKPKAAEAPKPKPKAAPEAPKPKPAAPAAAPRSSSRSSARSSSAESSNNNEEDDTRAALLAELDRRMEKHARCVEKCRAYSRKVDRARAQLMALGKK